MTTRREKVAILASFLLILSMNISAQEKKEPPQRRLEIEQRADTSKDHEARLPKIDLPEFIITGREVIQLPAARKMVLDEDPRPPLDPSKLTVLGEKTGSGAGRKTNALLEEEPLSYDGKLNLGYGSFRSPHGEIWFGKTYEEGDLSLRAQYFSHGAYVPHANAIQAGFDGRGGLVLPQRLGLLGGSRFFGQAFYQGKRYRFFGTPTPSLERTVNSFEVGAGLLGKPEGAVRYESSVHFRRLTVEDRGESRDDELRVALRTSGKLGSTQLKGELFYAANLLSQSFSRKDPHYFRKAAWFRKLLFKKLNLAGGIGLYLFRNSDADYSSKLYPNLSLQYYIDPSLTWFAQFEPTVERNSLSILLSANPYIGHDVQINHQDVFMNLSTGIQLEWLNHGSARLYLKYQRVRGFSLYVDPSTFVYIPFDPVPYPDSDFVYIPPFDPVPYPDWDVDYAGTTRFVSMHGEVHLNLKKINRLTGAITILTSRNSETGARVPYQTPVLISSTYSHFFPFGLVTRLEGRFVGRRPIDLHDQQELKSFFLLGASVEYQIRKNFSILLHLNNIFDEQYSTWNRYQELPFTIRGEVSIKW